MRELVWFFVGFALVGVTAISALKPELGSVVAAIRATSPPADPDTVREIERALLGF